MARDLMFQQEIKDTVQQADAAIATGAGETVARQLYSDQELAEVPPGAIQWALGGLCCIWLTGGMLTLPLPLGHQIAKANSSNATATRRVTDSSTASS